MINEARRAHEFGILVGEIDVDFAAVMDRVRSIIDKGATATQAWLESLDGVELVCGEGTLPAPPRCRSAGARCMHRGSSSQPALLQADPRSRVLRTRRT